MIEISLTQGKIALIDDEDYELISSFKWHAFKDSNTFYAATKIKKPDGNYTTLRMHKLLTNFNKTDHINHNGLDNRRSNLRDGSVFNNRNKLPQLGYSSKFKGVLWKKDSSKYRSVIRVNNKQIHLGLFDCEVAAARAYDRAAIEHFGEFACLNFPS